MTPLDCDVAIEVCFGEADHLFDVHPAAVVRPDRYIFGVVDEGWDLDVCCPSSAESSVFAENS